MKQNPEPNRPFLSFTLAVFLLFPVPAFSATANETRIDDLLQMDLKQLMQLDVTVTSVSKRPQKLHEAASAIYVVTQEDIRRTGATNVMEALRVVPGVMVSKLNQNQYAISVRGFHSRFGSNKLLVLMDGRTLYSPISSGVDWVAQDTVLEDIDRIEVIRGPGATLWGSNAVAGVVNIITKTAAETRGTLLSGGSGTAERGFGTGRYGGKLGENFDYRVYSKYRNTDSGAHSDDTEAFDGKKATQGGFRSDWRASPRDRFTFQGDYYEVDAERDSPSRFISFSAPFTQPFQSIFTYSGGNFISRWERTLENGGGLKFQAYYDRAEQKSAGISHSAVDQADLEFQHDFRIGEAQQVSWGTSFRHVGIEWDQTISAQLPNQDTSLFGFFVHDEIALVPQTWSVILGSKLEHNDYSGFEVQPNARTVWTPSPKHTLWGAVSRAVRLPSANENGLQANIAGTTLDSGLPLIFRAVGNNSLKAEEALVYEAGYRTSVFSNFSVDVTGFLNEYDNLIEYTNGSMFMETGQGSSRLISPLVPKNSLRGEAYGVELNAEWRPLKAWLLAGGYSWTKLDLRPIAGENPSTIFSGGVDPEDDPHHLFNIRSYLELPHSLEFDAMTYFLDWNKRRQVPSYTRLDLRLGWRPVRQTEFSLMGQNLLEGSHPEFGNYDEFRSETRRSFFAKATFRF